MLIPRLPWVCNAYPFSKLHVRSKNGRKLKLFGALIWNLGEGNGKTKPLAKRIDEHDFDF
jgi:hypothetical protein